MGWIERGWRDLWKLFAPRRCAVCGCGLGDNDRVMCIECWMKLPETHNYMAQPNELHDKLFVSLGCRIQKAVSLMYYQKDSPYASLITHHKYRYCVEIGRTLGMRYARTLMKAGFFKGIDVVLPMPMFVLKEMWKGFNHAKIIAEGICEVSGIPLGDNLKMVRPRPPQKQLDAEARYANVSHLFAVSHPEELEGLHILLVDDVMTTGSTLRAAASAINKSVPTARISILTLAVSTGR